MLLIFTMDRDCSASPQITPNPHTENCRFACGGDRKYSTITRDRYTKILRRYELARESSSPLV